MELLSITWKNPTHESSGSISARSRAMPWRCRSELNINSPCRPYCRRGFLLRVFGERRFGSNNQASDRRVLKRGAPDLGRVDDAELDQIAELALLGVEAEAIVIGLEQLADHHSAVAARVVDDLARRGLNGLAHDPLVGVGDLQA